MTTLLHINSCIRGGDAAILQLTARFIDRWKEIRPDSLIIERDLAAEPLPHVTEQMMCAFSTPAAQRSAKQQHVVELADRLASELLCADLIVISEPMPNFWISSSLLAWIDHVTRSAILLKQVGCHPSRRQQAWIFTCGSGSRSSGMESSIELQEPYLRGILVSLGVSNVRFMALENPPVAAWDAIIQAAKSCGGPDSE